MPPSAPPPAPLPPSPSPPPPTPPSSEECRSWCHGHSAAWSIKCNWGSRRCAGCPACTP
jgi:hypothetical protein